MSARKTAILKEVFRDFLQSVRANAGIVATLKLGHDRLVINPFKLTIRLQIFHSALYALIVYYIGSSSINIWQRHMDSKIKTNPD
jgi:hypothetical protein